ncbi:CRISPR associated protein Cas2 [Lachnospiraceae bacterium NE2001]|nr:CRISPR associated protein Cas2 [Lachnospiraceae bacterium NE2001]
MKEKVRVLVIYDVSYDKRRRTYMKLLNSFGYRVQESAYEAHLSYSKYDRLKKCLKKLENDKDTVIIYKLNSLCEIISYGDTSYRERMIYDENVFV